MFLIKIAGEIFTQNQRCTSNALKARKIGRFIYFGKKVEAICLKQFNLLNFNFWQKHAKKKVWLHIHYCDPPVYVMDQFIYHCHSNFVNSEGTCNKPLNLCHNSCQRIHSFSCIYTKCTKTKEVVGSAIEAKVWFQMVN